MRFRMVSLLAGAAVLALSAGGALAISDNIDQHQDAFDAPSGWDAGDHPTAQTFTAAVSGQLDRVSLYATDVNGSTFTFRIETVDGSGHPTGTLLAPGATTTMVPVSGWFDVTFSTPPSVLADSKYAIVFGGSGFLHTGGTCTASTYTRGEALFNDSGWAPLAGMQTCNIADLAFVTHYVSAPTQTTKLQWDKTQVTAGGTTPLTLTETFTFVAVVGAPEVVPAGPAVSDWTIQQVSLPAWFHVGSVSCSTQIAPAACTLANVAPGASIPVTPDGNPIIVKLIGTASPDQSAGGTTGTATGEGCRAAVTGSPAVCVTDQATVAVGAFVATAPPTTTGSSGPIGDSAPLLPILACLAFGGMGIAAVEAQRRTIRS